MSGTITHEWVGTTLVVTSDSGTSACDLKGQTGDIGVRGPQGSPGVALDSQGNPINMNDYYNKQEVDALVGEGDGGGTTVTVGGEAVATFDADTKVDVYNFPLPSKALMTQTFNESTNKVEYGVQILQASDYASENVVPVYQGKFINCSYEPFATLNVCNPQYDYQCATKKYVDEAVAAGGGAYYRHNLTVNVDGGGDIRFTIYSKRSTQFTSYQELYDELTDMANGIYDYYDTCTYYDSEYGDYGSWITTFYNFWPGGFTVTNPNGTGVNYINSNGQTFNITADKIKQL